MTAIAVFSGLFCNADSVVSNAVDLNGFNLISDHDVIVEAARLSGLDNRDFDVLFRIPDGSAVPVSPRERERRVGWLRLALAERLSAGSNVIIHGYVSLLAAREMEGVLRVCLISDMQDRLKMATQVYGLTESAALDRIHADDQVRADWAMAVTDGSIPWDEALYDLLIPVHTVGVAQSAFLIVKQLAKVAMRNADTTRRSLEDFLLVAKVNTVLAEHWQGISVSACDGEVSVRFGSHRAVLSSLGRLLCDEVSAMTGVQGVEMGLGGNYWQGDLYMRRGRGIAVTSADMKTDLGRYAGNSQVDRELAERVDAELTLQGYPVSVFVRNGMVSLTINSHHVMLRALSQAVCRALAETAGVKNLEVGVGTGYQRSSSYDEVRRQAVRARTADKGRRFKLTRSSRLQSPARSFSVYDESAWSPEKGREGEVLVLDVKTSGHSGIDALRRIKRERPDVDVLILADPASEADRAAYLGLGAFAYLSKPVNLGLLGHTIWPASEKGRFCSP